MFNANSTLFPRESRNALGLDLTKAVLRAEGIAEPGTFHLRNTAALDHHLAQTVRLRCSRNGSGKRQAEHERIRRKDGCRNNIPGPADGR